jgi:hypothetical protein
LACRAGTRAALLLLGGAAAGGCDGTPTIAGGGTRGPTQPTGTGYDIVYVRQPRFGDQDNTLWPEVFHPARIDAGADLMLLHPDGREEVLVAGGDGSVTDPFVSFDGEWVYYSLFPDLRPEALNFQRGDLPYSGADIHRIHLPTRRIEQLTFGEFAPNTGAGRWDEHNPIDPPEGYNRLGYGILNLGPCPLPGGRIVFTSNRHGFEPPKGYTNPTLQLFVMDEDGGNVTAIAPMTIGNALHPTVLRDGRVMFSSYESQGLRDQRMWGIWTIWPDGRQWAPLVSAFHAGQAFHFMTQLSTGDIVVEDYYNLNNNGFGAFLRMPPAPPAGSPAFHSAFPQDNPGLEYGRDDGQRGSFTMPFTPVGMIAITPFTHPFDNAAPPAAGGGERTGKVTQPSGAPGGDLLLVWTPGPANDLDRPVQTPRYDAGIYLMPAGGPAESPDDLVLLKNDPRYNEAWPRAVVPYRDVHGVDEPQELPWLPNDGSVHEQLPAGTPYGLVLIKNDPRYNEAWPRAVVPYRAVHGVDEPQELPWLPNDGSVHEQLPAGTPYGLVGTSSFYKRESFPGLVTPWGNTFDGLDVFNTGENDQSSNWGTQGADAGRYDNADIWAVRLVAMEPNTHRSYGPNEGRHFVNHANERLRILGEIPLRKTDASGRPVLDPEGHPDTSFLARIPADTPFTFQTLDRDGLVLNMAQTWHQVRPGEMRADCGGCHAHSQQPLAFADTAAARPDYFIHDLSRTTPLLTPGAGDDPGLEVRRTGVVNVEFYRDVRPILQAHCVPCHTRTAADPPAGLVLDDLAVYDGLPGDYKRLAADSEARWGSPPVIANGSWRQTNASRYVRQFQSRRSLLMWKVFGRRLDGWSNADHPTETVPGDPATLPAGADPNQADLDFTGTIMPPPDGGVSGLSGEQKLTLGRWIDLGCPIDTARGTDNAGFGWFLDDLRPTLEVSLPRPGVNAAPLELLRIGVADANSGVDHDTLRVTADFDVAGRPAGDELADLFTRSGDGIYTLDLPEPLGATARAHLFVEIADVQGNVTRVDRRFTVE